jgi:beta-galactosidase
VLCREWNWTFSGGQKVKRTFKIFNDTRFDQAVTFGVRLLLPGLEDDGAAEETIQMKAGVPVDRETTIALPAVKKRTAGKLVLTCGVGGKEVFREVKPITILPAEGGPRPTLAKADLVVFDPKGHVQDRLNRRKIAYTDVAMLDKMPKQARVVVIGHNALTARQATDPRWQALAATGTRIIVLEQENPLHYQAVPADLGMTGRTGRIAFAENLEHPVFAGLEQADFFCWSGDHVVYRNAYRKASRGARSLVQCDEGLSYSALVECPLRDGLLLLCQMPVGAKLDSDPVAQRLFDNLLAQAASYRPVQKKMAIVFGKADLRAKMLESLGLKANRVDDLLAALRDKGNEIVVADASPGNLKALAGQRDVLKAFTERGGYLMLWGLTPEGLKSFNDVVGFDHVIRPFRMERVTLPAVRDPILAGLTMRDVVLESTKKIFPWSGDLYPADDGFTHVVDLDDIAPFCSATGPGMPHGWLQMTNGLVSADAWVFIFSHNLKDDPKPRWTAKLPKQEEITRFEIVPNTFYYHLRKLRLVFDGVSENSVMIDLKPSMTRQDFKIDPPRKARSITLVPEAWDRAHPTTPVISIENLWIRVKRPASYRKKVVPLLNIGALVKYRMGKGGIILNQVKVQPSEANPVNAQKKRTIVSTLLGNLGAVFAGQRLLVAGANLRYEPIPLGEKCNQYLGGDKGWLKGQPDLSHLPRGEQTLAQVRYLIRDFRTSPVPSCIMLAGKDARGDLPKQVTGIPVGKKADVLFFLHTLHPTKQWKPAANSKAEPPAVVEYVVHYDDGKSQVVPVRLGRGIGRFLVDQPAGLPGAAVAWAARPEKGGRGRQTVLYQMPWTNPRPGVTIKSLDVRYGAKDGNEYGVPVLVAVTAARAE